MSSPNHSMTEKETPKFKEVASPKNYTPEYQNFFKHELIPANSKVINIGENSKFKPPVESTTPKNLQGRK